MPGAQSQREEDMSVAEAAVSSSADGNTVRAYQCSFATVAGRMGWAVLRQFLTAEHRQRIISSP